MKLNMAAVLAGAIKNLQSKHKINYGAAPATSISPLATPLILVNQWLMDLQIV